MSKAKKSTKKESEIAMAMNEPMETPISPLIDQNQNQSHNAKKGALGPNTRRKG